MCQKCKYKTIKEVFKGDGNFGEVGLLNDWCSAKDANIDEMEFYNYNFSECKDFELI